MEEKDVFEIKRSKKGILGFLFLLIIIGGIIYGAYYFIQINEPKKVLINSIYEVIQDTFNDLSIKEDYNKVNIDSKFSIEIDAPKDEYQELYSIINRINLEMYLGYDDSNLYMDLKGLYDNDILGDITFLTSKDDSYIYLNNIYDKVIKLNNESIDIQDYKIDMDSENYQKYLDYEFEAIEKAYNKIDLTSSYVKLDTRRVREIKINNIKEVIDYYYDILLDNKEYINLLSKIRNIKEEDVVSLINEYKDKIDDVDVYVYMSMLKNKFIKLDVVKDKDKITIDKDKNIINLKLFKDGIILEKIEFKMNKDNLMLTYSDIEKSLDIKFNIDYKIDYNSEIKSKDTSSSILYSEISDKDMNDIMNKFMSSEGITSLIKSLMGEESSTI